MQTLELASRLIKRWGMGLGSLPADVQQSLLDCMNAGLQDFYSIAPSVYREAPIIGVLAAPLTVEVGVTQGSSAFTGYEAAAGSYFATIRVTGDRTTDNLVVPPSSLLAPFQGTTGTWPAVLFGDAVPLAGNVERMLDEPALEGCRWRLQRNDEYWGRGWDSGLAAGPYSGNGVARRVGIPRTYWVEPNALCLGNTPAFVLRVDPLPGSLYTIRARALFYPFKLTMGNLQANALMPLNDAWVESMFIPIVLEKMTENELWTNKNTAQIAKNAEAARRRVSLLAPVLEKPNYRCETEPGW